MRESPVAAIPRRQFFILFPGICRKQYLRNIEILNVVNLIPPLSFQALCPHGVFIQHQNQLDYRFIILVIPHDPGVRFQKRHIHIPGKICTQLVDIDRLVIALLLRILQQLSRNKIDNLVVLIHNQTCPVHPVFKLVHKRQRLARILKQQVNQRFLKNQIRFQQKGILFYQPVFCHGERVYVIGSVIHLIDDVFYRRINSQSVDKLHQIFTLIAHDHYNPRQILLIQNV